MKHRHNPVVYFMLLAAAAVSFGCGSSNNNRSTGGSTNAPVGKAFKGTVVGATGDLVAGATIYLVPAGAVEALPEITSPGVLAGTTESFDEPLEDLVAANGTTYSKGTTAANGTFEIKSIPDGMYFVFVKSAVGDTEHLPGGSWSRRSVNASGLRGQNAKIYLSSTPGGSATFIGMTSCLVCHPDEATFKGFAHRIGFRVPGVTGANQSLSEHPDIDDGLAFFLDAADHTGGTPVYHYDYDPSRGFDKFKTSMTDPSGGGGVVYAILWLWKDTADGKYKITFENVGNPTDPNNLITREAKLTYGGAVHKQRYMLAWPGRNGLYPLLQFQPSGDDARFDRTRKQFRDYHLNFFWNDGGTPGDPADDLIKDPDITKNIQRNCMGCHMTNYSQFTDQVTGEVLADSVEDPGGDFDIDGDGQINDINLGCESCHGPGSQHRDNAQGRWIINPNYITPSREVMLCNRCHDRIEGHGTIENDHPLNTQDVFAPPGISRDDFMTNFVTRKSPKESDHWPDFNHPKSHHMQGPDFVKSKHYRNGTELLTCTSCHDPHGGTGFDYGLIADPDATETPLCMVCHVTDVKSTPEHTQTLLGFAHGSSTAHCVDCHMDKSAKSGSGTFGFLLGNPTGTSGDDNITFFENDIHSHIFDVPRKDNVGVRGIVPAKEMPIPYTKSCGTCHDPSQLPFQ